MLLLFLRREIEESLNMYGYELSLNIKIEANIPKLIALCNVRNANRNKTARFEAQNHDGNDEAGQYETDRERNCRPEETHVVVSIAAGRSRR